MDEYMQEQVQSALFVLNDMLDTFESWYPKHYDFLPESSQEKLTKEELEDAKNQFAGTKIRLELGTYTYDDYDYLQWIEGRVLNDDMYFQAINTIVYALSEEYGI